MEISLELSILLFLGGLMLVFWVPYSIAEYATNGFVRTLSYPDERILPEWAKRWRQAHANLVENMTPFAIAVLAGEMLEVHTQLTQWCAVLFLLARLLHPFTQVTRMFGLRTLVFATGQSVSLVYLLVVAGQWSRVSGVFARYWT